VTVVVRPPTSGTYRFFRDHVLDGDDFAPSAVEVSRTRDVVEAVADSPAAIGFGGLVYGNELVHCRIDGVGPSVESVRDGTYPLARYLYFYSTEPPAGATKVFTDWAVSPAGQAVVTEVGFVPLWTTSP
jgi:phosphate transport system substrate-binding protein